MEACEECRAILRELQEIYDAIRERAAGSGTDLTAWVRGLDEAECARMREDHSHWKVWRRMQEHHLRTGHSPLLSVGYSAN